ncbi:MAG: hypothetical protein NMNS01_15740 [Nitrosomonas sp.]|nr:MAG: hypothetical protein NMNS01_15740 [Nitrosomonas sp.]
MLLNKISRMSLLVATCLLVLSAGNLNARGLGDDNGYSRYLRPLVTAIDYHTRMIYLFNYENEKLIIVDPASIVGWPGDIPLQHTAVLPGANRIYISSDNTQEHPAYVIPLKIEDINWRTGSASLTLDELIVMDSPDMPAELPFVETVEGSAQNVPDWLLAGSTQVHGPTLLPYSHYMYWTEFTSDRVRVVNLRRNELANVDPIVIPDYTEQSHGITFNQSGSIGLGTGYFFDNSKIDVYRPSRRTGELQEVGQIMLGTEESYAAFTHFVYWLDERYALTATMQLDKTSLTPSNTDNIIPPSVWLLDAVELTAVKIIDSTDDVNGHGILRSASDLAVVNGKLYIAEEDSIDYEFARDGYISVFDITDRYNPVFVKRYKPGEDLPEGYAVAHTISPTPDHRHLIVASWVSGHVLKIDTVTDTVVKIWGPEDGLVKPHGIYAAGLNR